MAAPGVGVGQHGEESRGEDILQGRGLQVVEDLGPASPAAVVVDQELQGPVVIELAGSEEAQQEGIIQGGAQVRALLPHHVTEGLHVSKSPFWLLLQLLPGFGDQVFRQRAHVAGRFGRRRQLIFRE